MIFFELNIQIFGKKVRDSLIRLLPKQLLLTDKFQIMAPIFDELSNLGNRK
jgi:hypothetical protein